MDGSFIHTISGLNNVIIHMSSNHRVHQSINIMIMDIPKAQGLLLCRDWSNKLQGYFSTDWTHLWLPYKVRYNQIRVESEPYTKHNMTQLEGKTELVGFAYAIFGNFFLKVDHKCFLVQPSPIPPNTQLELLPRNATGENDLCTIDVDTGSIGCSPSISDTWILYFDGSKCGRDLELVAF